jgi:hypothetical protein
MRRCVYFLSALAGIALCASVQGQGFAALVSPPRFELATQPGKTLRSVVEVSNRSTAPARYLIHTADWTFSADFSVNFHDDLQPGSCRPWVAIERPEIVVPGGGTLRYRFEVAVPANAPPGECRFAVMIEGAEPSIARSQGLDMPVTGRIGVGGPGLRRLPEHRGLVRQAGPARGARRLDDRDRVHDLGQPRGTVPGDQWPDPQAAPRDRQGDPDRGRDPAGLAGSPPRQRDRPEGRARRP